MKHSNLARILAATVTVAAIGAVAAPAPAIAAAKSAKAALAPGAGGFVPLTPFRILDTRNGTGAAQAKVASNATLSFTVAGGIALPVPASNVTAVVLNVTVTGSTSSGFITAFPGLTPRPAASNLNFAKAQTVANLVTVGVGSNDKVSLYNGSASSVNLIADVAGYYVGGTAVDPGMFVSTAPTRLLDTRNGTGAAKHVVAPAGSLTLPVGGASGSPVPAGAKAVVLNVTTTTVTSSGFVTVYPAGGVRPTASNLNYTAGRTVPNLVTVGLGTGNAVTFYNGSSASSANLIADVAGYYLPGSATKAGAFVPVTPFRILDTRKHVGTPNTTPIDPTFDVGLQTVNVGGIPLDNVGAVVTNVTATAPTSTGFVTVSPTDPSRPTVSNLNHAKGQTIANLTIVPPGLCSKATFYNGSAGSTHLLADVAGYFLAKDASGSGSMAKMVKALGGNVLGDLADGTQADSSTPVSSLYMHDMKAVDGYGLGLTNDGTVWGWGPDMLAQLYAGKSGPTDQGYGNCSVPQRITDSHLTHIAAIAGSPADGYALDSITGVVYSWGFNESGQLGRNGTTDDFTPNQVDFAGTGSGGHVFTGITAGFALRDDGTVWGWGDNSDGRLGVAPSAVPEAHTPIQVASGSLTGVTAIGQGIAQYALMGDQTVLAWGSNESGALGAATTADSLAHPNPVNVQDAAGNLNGVVKIDGGMAVIGGAHPSLVTWGLNDRGQLGHGTIGANTDIAAPVAGLPDIDVTVGRQTIASSETNDVILGADGTMWVWGAGLANGQSGDSVTPHKVTGLTGTDSDIQSVGAGFESSFAVVP